jgi:hypothetical protein
MSASSFADSTFDYRSLLPTRSSASADNGGPSYESTTTSVDDNEVCFGFLPDLSWRERLIGCGTCMVAGYLLSMGSFWRLKDLVRGDPYPFVINATIGNIISLSGSFFLSGPHAQLQKMWHETRRVATAVYLASLILTLLIAFGKPPGPNAFYLLVLMACQYVTITWYCLSYIPFARDAVRSYARRWFSGSAEY